MIDVLNEEIIDLAEVCREQALRNPKTKKPAHISQAHRWVQIGARAANGDRVKLETIRTPSGRRTSREAVARFIASLTDPDQPATTSTPRIRQKQITSAEAELHAAGFEIGGNV